MRVARRIQRPDPDFPALLNASGSEVAHRGPYQAGVGQPCETHLRMSGGKACGKQTAQYTGEQPDEGTVGTSRDTAETEDEVHSSGDTLTTSQATQTLPLLLAADAPFAEALGSVPAED